MDLEKFRDKLKTYSKKDIVLKYHAELRAIVREIEIEEIKENIVNPKKLVFVEEQESSSNYKKYNCYFEYSKKFSS